MGSVITFIDNVNLAIGYVVTALFVLALAALAVRYTVGKVQSYSKKGENAAKGLFLGVLFLVEVTVIASLILLLPIYLSNTKLIHGRIAPSVFRWILLYLLVSIILYLLTKKHSGNRGVITGLVVLTIGLFGWWYDHWLGILLISLPIFCVLLYLTYRLAQVVLPSSDPEVKKEPWHKFRSFLEYLLGIQYPFWVIPKSASREIATPIQGDNAKGFSGPGTVWTHSHQVVGISAGTEFNRVDGPGLIFTKKFERPVAVVDLRTQLRTSEVDTTTKDGVPIRVMLFTSFIIDHDEWPKKGWRAEDRKRLEEDFKANPLLQGGLRVDKKIGSFAYSSARIKSVLSTTGVNTDLPSDDPNVTIFWDEWALKQIESATRLIVASRTIDELWRPIDNKAGASALDEIAEQIKKIVEPELRRVGINLFSSRIVNFVLDDKSQIRKQQLETWKTLWSSRITAAHADAEASYREEIEKAHAYAKSEILGAIAESIEKARAINVDLPRHVIALYYIHAIEEIIRKQPEFGSQEAKERLEIVKQLLLSNQ